MTLIFISFSRKDKNFAEKLTNHLTHAGYEVWIDLQNISIGEVWSDETARGIERADIFIVLLSKNALSSQWVEREIFLAQRVGKKLIPILIEDTEIPPALINLQYIDARNFSPTVLARIISAIQAIEYTPRHVESPTAVFAAPSKSNLRRMLVTMIGILGGLILVVVLIYSLVTNELKDDTPTEEASFTETSTLTPTNTETLTPTKRVTVSATAMDIQGQVEATLTAISEASTEIAASNPPSPIPTATFNVEQQVNATIVAIRATEENVLSPAEAGELAALTLTQSRRDDRALFFLLGILSLMVSMTLILLFIPMTRTMRLFQARTAHPSQEKPEPLLEEYQVFVSSSEKDKEWVKTLVRDLGELGFLVWWYAKDAPGLPFGKEIQSAIYYTKVFLIVISPDAMVSQHIEEEIRWAEIHKRPIVSILYRPTPVEKYLYGLAKGAGIDFTNEREYKGSMEDLTQAVNHHLKKRLETVSSESEEES